MARDIKRLALAIGAAIDKEGRQSGPYSTLDIAKVLAGMTASAAATCQPANPASGIEFAVAEFFDELERQCSIHKIEGVTVSMLEPPTKERSDCN